jgi:glucokinase
MVRVITGEGFGLRSPVVLGIDFGGTKTAVAVCEADGAMLGSASVPVGSDRDARTNVASAVAAGRALLDRVAPRRPLASIGVSTFGIPGPRGVALAPAIPGWADLALAREIGTAFDGVPVKAATDVKAAAQVEAERGALAGCDPAIYLNLGTGLAVALVVGGRVVAGRNGASGEIGYNLRGLSDVGRVLGDRVMLEDVVSGGALVAAARAAVPGLDGVGAVFTPTTERPALGRLLDEFLAELAFHLINLTIAVDPQRIAVGGGMVRSWDVIGPRLRAALDAAVPFPPELVPAAFPYEAPLIGALALGVEAGHELLSGTPVTPPEEEVPEEVPSPR